MNLQDAVMKELIEEKVPVTLFLMNGFQIMGIIKAHDEMTVAVIIDGKHQLLYKHAISTIAPIRSLKCLQEQ